MAAKKLRRRLLASLAVAVLLLSGLTARPAVHLLRTAWRDVDERAEPPAGFIDDASRLNAGKVAETWPMPAGASDAEAQLAAVLARARAKGLPVSVGGARHSMGGQSIAPAGIVIDMRPWNRMSLDESRNILSAQAGATWKEVIAYLDGRGRSIGVMQSNNSFTVGGSLSVNCHGWTYGHPPIASTVESFRLMRADGAVVRCSRTENRELFSLALGGYGLFGVILDADLRVVPNARYRPEQRIVSAERLTETFAAEIENRPEVRMVYGRLNVASERFLKDAVVVSLVEESGEVPPLEELYLPEVRRAVFRGSAGSDYGKRLRWSAETQLQPLFANRAYSRNQLLNESADVLANRSAGSTDILHEYFVPAGQVAAFAEAMREVVPRHGVDLLNVTVRVVNEDEDTVLRYADRRMFAFVMLFVQEKSPSGESRMKELTRALIDAALAHEGRYYLPYRLHATPEQFRRAYPQAAEFFRLKRRHDPGELFQNRLYLRYGRGEE